MQVEQCEWLSEKNRFQLNCLSHILNIKVIYVRHTRLTVYSVTDFVQKLGKLTLFKLF
jgi:hypothetical protein